MNRKPKENLEIRRVELDGLNYVILRESVFNKICHRAGIDLSSELDRDDLGSNAMNLDGTALAERLVLRRRVAGLSQAALARRAGIRPETLNRIERGRTTPDFATIRKLVLAMNAAENPESKENRHVRK